MSADPEELLAEILAQLAKRKLIPGRDHYHLGALQDPRKGPRDVGRLDQAVRPQGTGILAQMLGEWLQTRFGR